MRFYASEGVVKLEVHRKYCISLLTISNFAANIGLANWMHVSALEFHQSVAAAREHIYQQPKNCEE